MGRNREFDVEKALNAALCVFWRKGYEGASYRDLTLATGVERPALYSAFGNKESLFMQALQHYHQHYLDYLPSALTLDTSHQVTAHILHSAADLVTRYPEHTGCLGINGALACSDDAEPVQRALVAWRNEGEEKLKARYEQDQQRGDLPPEANPSALAAYIFTVIHGMAVQAKAGFSREKLEGIIKQTLAGWPINNRTG